MKVKLTAPDGTTKNGMVWRVGETNRATGEGCELCTSGVLHFYDSLELAAFMSPIHVDWEWEKSLAFEVRGRKVVGDATKSGAKSLTVVREIEFVVPTLDQFVAFGILAAKEVYPNPNFVRWADNWLNGKDRSAKAALEAGAWARAAAPAAATAAQAAWVRAAAARAAAWVRAAAARAAATAAAAAAAHPTLDLQALAEQALREF